MEKPLVYINTYLYIGRMLNTTVELDRLSDRLKALSDSTRLRILSQLACGECCQCEINDELGLAAFARLSSQGATRSWSDKVSTPGPMGLLLRL
jgi:DNA-binding transcriptional ArsR family regulator